MPHSKNSELTSALADGLDSQIAAMQSLRACLEEEHRVLQTRDPDELLSVADRKSACLGEAGRLNRQYQEIEARQGPTRPDTTNRELGPRRDKLDTLTRLCRDLNNANGSLIRRQKNRVEKTLHILRGEPERTDVYGPSGATMNRTSGRRILASI